MKVVILAGGLGTRISEETVVRPKPMVEIGGKPILWHIMKQYSHYGFNEFVIALGYKGYMIKEYFANYYLHMSDVTVDIRKNAQTLHHNHAEPWKVTLVDTGLETMTGGRIKRIQEYIGKDKDFCLTYGDGVSSVDIKQLVKYHKQHRKKATLTAVRPPARFGALEINAKNTITAFKEKPVGDGDYINGGFFVLSSAVFDYIDGDGTIWEREPLEKLANEGQLMAYQHDDFWQCMDTLRDRTVLEEMWLSTSPAWKVWS